MGMTDPYQKFYESITKALNKQTEMIVWIAKRVLSAKEFAEFVDEFAEKTDKKSEVMDSLKKKGQKNGNENP